jgi:CRP-like cAMP-binding protein
MAADVDALRKVKFLAPLNDRNIRGLAKSMTVRTVPAGEPILSEGERAIAFFVILDGEATVLVGGNERRTLGPGDHFGEIALVLPNTPRTASVLAKTDVQLGAMASWNFKSFVAEHPEVTWPLLETVAQLVADSPGA